MKNFNKTVLKGCFFFALSLSVNAFAAEKKQALQVYDAGIDGDERFYTVYCPDGKRASLVKRFKIGEVCTQPSYAEKDICRDWTVDEAAQEACK